MTTPTGGPRLPLRRADFAALRAGRFFATFFFAALRAGFFFLAGLFLATFRAGFFLAGFFRRGFARRLGRASTTGGFRRGWNRG